LFWFGENARVDLTMLKRIPPFLRNRYAAVLAIFVLYISFFDAHDLISQIEIKLELKEIYQEISFLNEDSEAAKRQIHELTSDKAKLEKFAREQYRMKRENEEIFVLLQEK
jgi:cell division protein FtsB